MKAKRILSVALSVVITLSVLTTFASASPAIKQTNSVVAGGLSHTLAIKSDGTVWAWGSNEDYQLAQDEKVTENSTPTKVEKLSTQIIDIAAGNTYSAALSTTGTVYIWGGKRISTPTAVSGLNNIFAIEIGANTLLALDSAGVVWETLLDAEGEPKKIEGLPKISSIAAGSGFALAISCSGDVWSWGANSHGQLGIGTTDYSAVPVKISEVYDIVSIAAGNSHSVAAAYDGTVYAWGSNASGQLGTSGKQSSSVPIAVARISRVVQVSAGTDFSMALTKAGKVYTWGTGEYGQLGYDSAPNYSNTPKEVVARTNSTTLFIASGAYHNLLIDKSGVLYSWGRNKSYQIGVKTTSNVTTPRSALSGIREAGAYNISTLDRSSSWALAELQAFYDTGLGAPVFWDNYQNNITRGELAHLLVNLYDQVTGSQIDVRFAQDKFSDIKGHKYEASINKAYSLKILEGKTDGTFGPDSNATRQEAAKMICSFVALVTKKPIPTTYDSLAFFKDSNSIAEWAAPYVHYAYVNEIMRGSNDNFEPLAQVTIEQSLLIVARSAKQNSWTVK